MMGSEAIAYKEAANKFSLSALSCSVVQAKRGDFRPRLFQLPPEPGLDKPSALKIIFWRTFQSDKLA